MDTLTFGMGANANANVLIFGVGEISMSQMCYLWSEILGRRNYLGSDVSSISLSKPFS